MKTLRTVRFPSWTLLVALLVAIPASATGQALTEDTTWSGTVVVDRTLEVPAGITLRI